MLRGYPLTLPLTGGLTVGSVARTITIQYLKGCPHKALAEARVAEAVRRCGGPAPAVILQEIADAEDAARVGFAGSPTVLVDGIDPFDRPRAGAGFACRLYPTEDGNEGAPSLDQLCAALAPA